MKDREVISRNIINILDVKHCREYGIFEDDDLYDALLKYLKKLAPEAESRDIDMIMTRNELTMKKIVEDKDISLEEMNRFMEDLKSFKRKYLLNKDQA